jgi:hypothetical protein
MGIDRSNIPDEYMCERCQPRHVDRQHARTLQLRKREELLHTDSSSDTSSSTDTDGGKCITVYWNVLWWGGVYGLGFMIPMKPVCLVDLRFESTVEPRCIVPIAIVFQQISSVLFGPGISPT